MYLEVQDVLILGVLNVYIVSVEFDDGNSASFLFHLTVSKHTYCQADY